jgi:sulfite reductase (NADPH) flavoprotein alpha-component
MARAIRILFGTETGNAEECATKLERTVTSLGLTAELQDMDDYALDDVVDEELVLIVTSTFGNGQPPFNARGFMDHIKGLPEGSLTGVKFAVCGLGDQSYPNFAKCGKDFDARFEGLGAERVVPRMDCDVSFDKPFAKWQASIAEWLIDNDEGASAPIDDGASSGKNVGLMGSFKKWFSKA